MTFETTLPSLIGKWKTANAFPNDYIVVPVLDVVRDCIDKQKVREAIEKLKFSIEHPERKDQNWIIMVDSIYRELGL